MEKEVVENKVIFLKKVDQIWLLLKNFNQMKVLIIL